MRKPVILTLALAVLALFFGLETRHAWIAPSPAGDNAAAAGSGTWQPGVTGPEMPPPKDFSGVVAALTARPLFRPDRQPYREPVAPVLPARNYELELSQFSLLGILAFGNEPMGLVTGRVANRPERWEVKAGDSLPGFSVKEVRVDGLTLAADGREFLLPLYAGPPTAAKSLPVRTEVPRKDAAAAQPAAAPAPPKPAPAPAPAQPRSAPPPAPVQPAPSPGPSVAPRYIPGRR
jgi:hypothetical protein